MRSTSPPTRMLLCCVVRVAPVVFGVLLAPPAQALDPDRHLSQYGHFAWRIQDGNFAGSPNAITQTLDGYLWIGTDSGLFRFDGVAFSPGFAAPHITPPNTRVKSLLGTKDGALMIGGSAGLWRFQNNQLVNLIPTRQFNSIREGPNGDIWVGLTHGGGGAPFEPLCVIDGATVRCYGSRDGITCSYSDTLAVDSHGTVWIGDAGGLCRYPPGSPAKYFEQVLEHKQGLEGVKAIAISRQGEVVAGLSDTGVGEGLQQFDGKDWRSYRKPGIDGSRLSVTALLFDRDESLWIGTYGQGIYRVHNGHADHFTMADGLSDDVISTIYEDREGLIWVGTASGLDAFRNLRVATYSIREGLSNNRVNSVAVSQDGTLWIGNGDSLDVLHGKQVTRNTQGMGRLPGRNVTSLIVDRNNELWVGVDDQLLHYDGHGHFKRVTDQAGRGTGLVATIAEDSKHTLWVDTLNPVRLLRVRDSKIVEVLPVPSDEFISALAVDADGDMWFSLGRGLARYAAGNFVVVPDGHAYSKTVRDIFLEPDGSVWGITRDGVLHWANNQTRMLTTSNGLPCNFTFALIEDDARGLWLSTPCGYIDIEASEILRWLKDPQAHIAVRTLDALDGAVNGIADFRPTATKTADGRLWFATETVLQVIDPRQLSYNPIPPPVHVVRVLADRHAIELGNPTVLPALTRELEIDYTALSFVAPRKVKFRYKMNGYDADWVDPGTRRQAFYSGLGPGLYRFQVIASNNEGVWNEAGATIELNMQRAWFQTVWFRGCCLLLSVCLVWLSYRYRIHQVAQSIRVRFDERLNERTRIARDLHDTLLQSFHGLLLQLETARKLLPGHPAEARQTLETAIDGAFQAITEGRNAVQGLRGSILAGNDLAEAIKALGQELAAQGRAESAVLQVVEVTGTPRALRPLVRDEIYRIASESLRNALHHAEAKRIEVEICYDDRLMRLRVRDDGKGIGAVFLREEGAPGHFGIHGMRERAKEIGGILNVWTAPNSGTEVELRVPASHAYEEPSPVKRRWSLVHQFGRGTSMGS